MPPDPDPATGTAQGMLHGRTPADCAHWPAACVTLKPCPQKSPGLPSSTPLVLDSPHSGTQYPDDFGSALDLTTLRRAGRHASKDLRLCPALGVTWVEAHFPIYLDANRDTTEAGHQPARWRLARPHFHRPQGAQQSAPGLNRADLEVHRPGRTHLPASASSPWPRCARIDRCWRPYHAAVAQAIDAAHARHGWHPPQLPLHARCGRALCHRVSGAGACRLCSGRPTTTASPALSALICEHLRACGCSVECNHPTGVELVRRYGNPAAPPQHPGRDQPQTLHGRDHARPAPRRHGPPAGRPANPGAQAVGARPALTAPRPERCARHRRRFPAQRGGRRHKIAHRRGARPLPPTRRHPHASSLPKTTRCWPMACCARCVPGAVVDHVASGSEADAALMTNNEFDLLILLTWACPRCMGWKCSKSCAVGGSALPVLILTAADSVEERVKGPGLWRRRLHGQALQPAELEARVRALTRRAWAAPAAPSSTARWYDQAGRSRPPSTAR